MKNLNIVGKAYECLICENGYEVVRYTVEMLNDSLSFIKSGDPQVMDMVSASNYVGKLSDEGYRKIDYFIRIATTNQQSYQRNQKLKCYRR